MKPFQRARADRVAELRRPSSGRGSRRSPGAPAPDAPTATSRDPGRCERRQYEIPCRARVSASPADGRPAANSRCTESSARMVCGGVSGIESRTPHGLLAEHLQRLVVAVAPHLGGERCAGNHQHPAGGGRSGVVLVEPVRGLLPVRRDRVERARRGQPPRPGQRGAGSQRGQHHDADGDPLVVLRVGEGAQPLPVAARCPAAECGQADARVPAPAAAG